MAKEPLIIKVRAALKRVLDPKTGRDIVADGRIEGLAADAGGVVRFAIRASDADRAGAIAILDEAKSAVAAVEGVTRVAAVATAHGAARTPPQSPSARPASPSPAGGHDNPIGLQKRARIEDAMAALPEVGCVLAVASGKGGVGKSTVAANLAVALARAGWRTGLMDADVYGPSLPTLFGVKTRPAMRDGRIVPHVIHGVRAMSIGWLVEEDKALAWRGPMVMGAVRQLMTEVDWGPLDILVIDTPPGTGDAHLTLAQTRKLNGAVIVSTPQEMALADVRRGVELFRKTDVEVIGVIENMAYLSQPDGSRLALFGEGGAKRAAADLGAPFLGEIPFYPALREASDAGAPVVATAPESPAAAAFIDLAATIAAALRLGAREAG